VFIAVIAWPLADLAFAEGAFPFEVEHPVGHGGRLREPRLHVHAFYFFVSWDLRAVRTARRDATRACDANRLGCGPETLTAQPVVD
jgi:hypothetical protein